MNWYAARVLTGKEYDLKKKLQASIPECEIYIPRQLITDVVNEKVVQRTEKLVPGYIFIGTETDLPAAVIDGFLQVLGLISESELNHLRELEYIESTDSTPQVGQRIIVTDGPFIGCKGVILEWEENTAKCRLVFQGLEINAGLKKEYINSIK